MHASGLAMPTANTTEVAVGDRRLAAVCDVIESYRDSRTPISGRRAAALSAMIADLVAPAAASEANQTRRKRHSMGSSSWYEEVCRLGEGYFGVVAKARHLATGHVVAVKSLRPRRCDDDDDDDEAVYDLLREACFLAACRGHPSLVGLHGVLRAPRTGDYSLAMDYVGPTTLADMLVRRDGLPFPEADARRIMRQLLDAADAMHSRGIVHRDIKPENILVAGNGDGGALKICDLGLATYVGERDPPYMFGGTVPYMAPEVLVESVDQDHGGGTVVVDSWSLGCVMAELLLGGDGVLFDGESTTDQLYKIFDVLGVPGKKVWQSLKPSPCMADEVRHWRTRRRVGLGQRSSNRLRGIFPEEVLSKDGFEVLSGLLTCDPRRRLTAAAALRCRWLTDDAVDVDGDGLVLPAATPVVSSEAGDTPTTVWSQVVACVGRGLGLLTPKGLWNSIVGLNIGT